MKPPRLAINYMILSAAELFSKALTALAFAYLARVLGPAAYGRLEFVLAVVFIATLLVDSGQSTFGAREIAKDATLTGKLMKEITAARFGLACLVFALLAAMAFFTPQPPVVRNLILLYAFTVLLLPGLAQWVFQGHDRMTYVALASILRWTVFSSAVFLLVRTPEHLARVPLIEAAAIGLAGFFLLACYFRLEKSPGAPLQVKSIFNNLRQSLPIGASELVWAAKVYFATMFLGFTFGGQELGWFGAAHRIVISLHAFVFLYFFNLLPSIARSSKQPLEDYRGLMQGSMRLTAWIAIFIGICGTAFASTGIELLYGPQYTPSASVFRILVWMIPLTLLSGHYRYTLIGFNRQSQEFLSALAGAVVNVALNLTLIPLLGINGAAWALILSEITIWGVAAWFVRRSVDHLTVLPHLRQPVLIGLLLIPALYFLLPVSPWLAGAAAALLFTPFFSLLQPHLNLRRRRQA